jgi:class 3 adenylate cyclase/tetratricopeptide (TPR) repeat protein
MDFYAVLDQVLALLRQRGRVSYRALKRQFDLDDAYLDDLKVEIIEVQQCARDQEGTMLVWTGQDASAAAPTPIPPPAPLAYTPPYLAEKILTSRSALEGERKLVTVLFADLKGSTELIAGLDPEEARTLLDPALHVMMDAVHRYEGTVNQVLGDGIMALFGAPVAHEDHAVRACYAALAMQAAMRRYAEDVRRSHGLEMQARVGLNSGEVVVRTIGNDLHMDYSAVGQTTHLAARMEQLATPGSIRLTAATLRLAEGLVQVNALGRFPVKGLPDPVEVYELIGTSALRQRLQASAARGLTRFVGRQQELMALQQALERAGAGHGQVAALVGEAGMGKSRLVYECVHAQGTQGWRVLESASVSYGKATPYFPVIDLFKRYCHVDDSDDVRTTRAKVTGQIVTLDETLQDTLPALLALLDAVPDDSPFLRLDPPQRRQRTLDGLKRVLLRASQVQPLLLVCEDLHWIDTETQALLDHLVESLPTTHVLLLVNYRPEYQHSWGSKTYYTQLRLDSLPPASADELLQALLGDDPSLAPLTQLLLARTEGNPFFLEESVRTLVETGVLVGQPGTYGLAKPLDSLQVPATVHAVLAARIDRLPAAEKRLLQTAAVIGTEVPLPLLQAVAELPEDALYRGLAHLQAAEFLYETRLFPEREYTFTHALTHEVAYSSLLQERRRVLHAQIVPALETLAADRLAEHIERLAHHAMRGEVWDKALAYCRQAGEKAMTRPAFREAVTWFEQALVASQRLPRQRDLLTEGIDLRLNLDTAFLALGDPKRGFDSLREAAALAEELDDQRRLGPISCAIAHYVWRMGDYAAAIEYGQRALVHTTASGDIVEQARAQGLLGTVYFSLGDYRRAADVFRQSVAAVEGDLRQARSSGLLLPSVRSRSWLVSCLAELGEFPEGMACGAEAVQIAEAAGHLHSAIFAQLRLGTLVLRRGDLQHAIFILERAFASCQAADIALFFQGFAGHLGLAYALAGRVAEALPLFEQVVEQAGARTQGSTPLLKGEGSLLAGHLEEARPLAERALTLSRTHKAPGIEAWALRLLGEIALQGHPSHVEQAALYYRQALTLAKELGMRPLQAHCHLALGTLSATVGQREQARAALTTAVAMYRAMDMTFWLPQAAAALAQVEGITSAPGEGIS